MKKAKHWYDYLWVYAIIYFALGFFNILFAWLGMVDFLLPPPRLDVAVVALANPQPRGHLPLCQSPILAQLPEPTSHIQNLPVRIFEMECIS
jgi:hypothetical protein